MYRIFFVLVLAFISACSQVIPPTNPNPEAPPTNPGTPPTNPGTPPTNPGTPPTDPDPETPTDPNPAEPYITPNGVTGAGEQIAVSQKLGAVFVVGNTEGALAGEYRGEGDVFLRRYNRSGKIVWQTQIGGRVIDFSGGITLDQHDNVYVGTTKCQLEGDYIGRCNGNLYKFNSNGKQLWVKRFSTSDGTTVSDIVAAANGNIYVTGDITLSQNIEYNFYLRAYDSQGNFRFEESFPAADIAEIPTSLTTDSASNVYMATRIGTDEFYTPSYLYKFSPGGEILWQKDPSGNTVFYDLQVVGNALYAGGDKDYYEDYSYYLDSDAYIAKYDLRGNLEWAKSFGTQSYDGASGISADARGNIYISGTTRGSLGGMNEGGKDAFIRKYTSNGKVAWTKQLGTVADDSFADVMAYSPTEIYATGYLYGEFSSNTRDDGVLLTRFNGSGQTNWLNQ